MININVGGLRIKSIIHNEKDNTNSEFTRFSYGLESDTNISSGRIVNYPINFRPYYTAKTMNSAIAGGPCAFAITGFAKFLMLTSFSSNVIEFNNQSIIGYSNVNEYHGISNNYGRINYKYSNIETDPDIKLDPAYDWPVTPNTSLTWNRGLLLQKVVFKSSNNNYIAVDSLINYYSRNSTWNLKDIRCVNIKAIKEYEVFKYGSNGCSPIDISNNTFWRPYVTTSGWYTLDSTIHKVCSENSKIIEKIVNSYSNPKDIGVLLLIKKEYDKSDHDWMIETMSYPHNYINVSVNDDYGIRAIQERHIVNQIVEHSVFQKKNNQPTLYLIKSRFNSFNNSCLIKRIYDTENGNAIVDFIPSFTSNGNIVIDSRYNLQESIDTYDTKGNLVEFHKQNGISNCYSYGYNSQIAISETKNSKEVERGYTSFENNEAIPFQLTTGNPNYYTNDPFTGKSSLMVQYGNGAYQIFAVNSNATNHSGYKASVWVKGSTKAYISLQVPGVSSTLRKAENTGNNIATWNLLSVELPRTLLEPYLTNTPLLLKVETGVPGETAKFDDLRFYPMDAEMTTFTYKPLIGMTSSSDANNKPTYYEYDAFGRLSVIKDYLGNILKKFDYHYRPQ